MKRQPPLPTLSRRHLCRLLPLGLVGLTGCGALLPGSGPPPNLYRLTPKSTFDPGLPTVDWQLVLAPPSAQGAIDTTRIALAPSLTRIEYYASAGWTDRMPLMFQALMLESFENSGHIVAVGRRAVGLRSDYELRIDIREFQADYYDNPSQPAACQGPPVCVHVVVNAKLIYTPQRTIVATRDFGTFAPSPQDDLVSVVEAFDIALGDVLKDLVGWTLIEGSRDWTVRQANRSQAALPAGGHRL
ncbi:MAG: ABC-type transport auxiliary lipoprotein family protein [Pseudomonadota bacterium]